MLCWLTTELKWPGSSQEKHMMEGQGSPCVHSLAAWQNSHSFMKVRTCFEIFREGTLTTSPLAASDDHSKFFPDFCDASCCTLQQILRRSGRGISLYPVTTVSASRWCEIQKVRLHNPGDPRGSLTKTVKMYCQAWLSTLYKLSPLILTPVL